jgi:enamine deaminase RidA (YjgF/YER057c/UK114 family)
MEFDRVFSGSDWEKTVGYCRAVKAGNLVFVAGTAAVADGGGVSAPGDAYAQTVHCLEIIRDALGELSVPIENVVRTRLFVTDISRWQEYGRAHREHFGAHPPVTAMLEVTGLVHPDMLVEIEADAVVTGG